MTVLRRNLVVIVAVAIDLPLAYLSLQLLGVNSYQLLFLAIFLGGVSVLAAHYVGGSLRLARLSDAGPGKYLLPGLVGASLVVMATFYGIIRMKYVTSSTDAFHMGGVSAPPLLVGLTFGVTSLLIWVVVAAKHYREEPLVLKLRDRKAALVEADQEIRELEEQLQSASVNLSGQEEYLLGAHERWERYRTERARTGALRIHEYLAGVIAVHQNPGMTTMIENLKILGEGDFPARTEP